MDSFFLSFLSNFMQRQDSSFQRSLSIAIQCWKIAAGKIKTKNKEKSVRHKISLHPVLLFDTLLHSNWREMENVRATIFTEKRTSTTYCFDLFRGCYFLLIFFCFSIFLAILCHQLIFNWFTTLIPSIIFSIHLLFSTKFSVQLPCRQNLFTY